MKRLCALLLTVIVLLASPAVPVGAATYTPPFEIYSTYAYLYNLDTEQVIFEKNPHVPCYPASVTKIMTAILALEYIEEKGTTLDAEILTYPLYVQEYLYTYGLEHGAVSLAGISAGEEMTMRDMLYGLMLRSGNEIAMTIADHIAGGQEAFAELMTRRARELGALNTTFKNPNGLFDPEHMTTAYDMAQITLHAMSLDGFMEIASTSSYTAGPTNYREEITWSSTVLIQNPANSYHYPGIQGIKTGTLEESGRCLVTSATRDGFTYLLVLLDAPFVDERGNELDFRGDFLDAADLFDWAFETFKLKALVEPNINITDIDIRLSMEQDKLLLATSERIIALIPQDIDPATSVTYRYNLPDSIDAPVEKGQQIGTATLMLAGEEMGTIGLLASEAVGASSLLVFLEKLKALLGSFWFKFGVIFVVGVIVLYVILMIIRNRNRRRFSNYKPRRRI